MTAIAKARWRMEGMVNCRKTRYILKVKEIPQRKTMDGENVIDEKRKIVEDHARRLDANLIAGRCPVYIQLPHATMG